MILMETPKKIRKRLFKINNKWNMCGKIERKKRDRDGEKGWKGESERWRDKERNIRVRTLGGVGVKKEKK